MTRLDAFCVSFNAGFPVNMGTKSLNNNYKSMVGRIGLIVALVAQVSRVCAETSPQWGTEAMDSSPAVNTAFVRGRHVPTTAHESVAGSDAEERVFADAAVLLSKRVAFLEVNSRTTTRDRDRKALRSGRQQQILPQSDVEPLPGVPRPTLSSSKVAKSASAQPFYDIRGMEKLPNCVAAVQHGSKLVNLSNALTTQCAASSMLRAGDYLIITKRSNVHFGLKGEAQRAAAARRDNDAVRLVKVLPSHAATQYGQQLLLDRSWGPASENGLAVFRVLLSADAIIGRIRKDSDLIKRVRAGELQSELAGEEEEKAKRTRSEEEEKAKAQQKAGEEEEKAKLAAGRHAKNQTKPYNVTCKGGVWLPGEIAVIAGSPVVTTSQDLRSVIPIGGRIWIANRTFVVTEPRDPITLTLSAPWPMAAGSASGLHACRLLVRRPVTYSMLAISC